MGIPGGREGDFGAVGEFGKNGAKGFFWGEDGFGGNGFEKGFDKAFEKGAKNFRLNVDFFNKMGIEVFHHFPATGHGGGVVDNAGKQPRALIRLDEKFDTARVVDYHACWQARNGQGTPSLWSASPTAAPVTGLAMSVSEA